MVVPLIGFTIKVQEIIIQIVRNEMKLEEASKIYTDLSIKYLDCIPFTPEEDVLWKEVCEIVFSDLRASNPDMFIDIKKSNKEKNMNDIEKIKQEIADRVKYIEGFTAEIEVLEEKLERLQIENWQPDAGNFVVETTGSVFLKNSWPTYSSEVVNSEIDFGSVRTTENRAKMAANNMRRFNRLSCFMGDSKPLLEHSPISVALVFYDYEMEKIAKLKKILETKGDL